MRYLVGLLLVCAACPGGGNDGECSIDTDCSGTKICARNSECLAVSEVRAVRVTWTIRGMPASESTCVKSPNLYVSFTGATLNDTFGYAPVPCKAGLFTVDRLPRRFVSAEIGVEHGFNDAKAFDANGNVTFDMSP